VTNEKWDYGTRSAEEQRAISVKKERVDIWRSADKQIPARKQRVDIWRSTNEQIPKKKELIFDKAATCNLSQKRKNRCV